MNTLKTWILRKTRILLKLEYFGNESAWMKMRLSSIWIKRFSKIGQRWSWNIFACHSFAEKTESCLSSEKIFEFKGQLYDKTNPDNFRTKWILKRSLGSSLTSSAP